MQDRRTFPNFARPSTVTTANMKIWKDIFSGKLKDGYILTFVGVIVDLLKIVDEQDEGGSERRVSHLNVKSRHFFTDFCM